MSLSASSTSPFTGQLFNPSAAMASIRGRALRNSGTVVGSSAIGEPSRSFTAAVIIGKPINCPSNSE